MLKAKRLEHDYFHTRVQLGVSPPTVSSGSCARLPPLHPEVCPRETHARDDSFTKGSGQATFASQAQDSGLSLSPHFSLSPCLLF